VSDDLKVLRDFAEGAPLTRTAMIDAVKRDLLKLIARVESPVPLILHCPMCHARHVDEGSQATTPHRTHACQNPRCGHLWAPAVVATVGVWTLPGCLNPPAASAHDHDWILLYYNSDVQRCRRCSVERRCAGADWQYRHDARAYKWISGPIPACPPVVATLGHHETCSYFGGGRWKCHAECRAPKGAADRGWDGDHALVRACPTCKAPPGEECSRFTGTTPTPPTVGDHDARFHEERCWR